jgi:Fur family ferric uptake transcriptional regulator
VLNKVPNFANPISDSMKSQIDEQLGHRNIKPTAMRELVMKVFSEQVSAISMADLERQFKKADRVTLYRTLKTFEENKLIHRIDDGTGSVKYALCTESCQCQPQDLHVHFLCTNCNQTFCLNDIPVPSLNLPVNFNLDSISMVVKGVCANCNK